MIQQEIAQGKPLAQATTEALHRFGDPKKIGRNIRKSWLQQNHGSLSQKFRWNWKRFFLVFIPYTLLTFVLYHFFPNVFNENRQHHPLTAIGYGLLHGIFMGSGSLMFCMGWGLRQKVPQTQELAGETDNIYKGYMLSSIPKHKATSIRGELGGVDRFFQRINTLSEKSQIFAFLVILVFIGIIALLVTWLMSLSDPMKNQAPIFYEMAQFYSSVVTIGGVLSFISQPKPSSKIET
jgi:hypothetical protein